MQRLQKTFLIVQKLLLEADVLYVQKKNNQTLCLILVEWTRIVWLMNTQLRIRTLYEINPPAMVSELPACLGHLLEDLGGVVGRAARTGMPPEQSSSPLPSRPTFQLHPQLSTKLSQEAAIWASTPFSSLPILGLTIQFGCTSSLCLFLGATNLHLDNACKLDHSPKKISSMVNGTLICSQNFALNPKIENSWMLLFHQGNLERSGHSLSSISC